MILGALQLERIRSDLQDPDLLRACEAILEVLQRTTHENLIHITYGQFRDLGMPNHAIVRSLHYLAGDVGLLEMRFEFITESEEIFEIPLSDIQENEKFQRFYDPHGESIDRGDFYRHVFPFFTPAELTPDRRE